MTELARNRLVAWGVPLLGCVAFSIVIVVSVRLFGNWEATRDAVLHRRYAYLAVAPLLIAIAHAVRPDDEHPVRAFVKLTLAALAVLAPYEYLVTRFVLHERPMFALNRMDVNVTIALIVLARACDAWGLERDAELRRARADADLSVANLQLLDSQLRPHFAFNTLNGVLALMHDDAEAARRLVRALREFFAVTLVAAPASITLREELDIVERYAGIEQIRFGDALRLRIDADAHALACAVPRMLLQPIVENAIRHASAGEVTIAAMTERERLRITVTNRGGAARPRQGMGIGLANARARLAAAYGDEAALQLRSANRDDVSSVEITMPAEVR